jgi:hypothetical protein
VPTASGARNSCCVDTVATALRSSLRRELAIDGKPYVLTITADGFKLVPKGKRKGIELAWRDLVSGEAALAVALNASLGRESPVVRRHGPTSSRARHPPPVPPEPPPQTARPPRRRRS